ncbi:MAG TPA: universal stress protein [Acidimicrobiales bacterium]|jgi:nucleotide-binding universal stress UspA family protein
MSRSTQPKIVVGVDGSGSSRHALRWATRQAQFTGARLEVVITWELPTSFGWVPPYPEDFNPAHDAQTAADEEVALVLADYPDVDVHVTVVEGHPAPSLIKASRDAELLVLGSRGHGEFAGMLLGSVTQHCVSTAHCPVLVWRRDNDPA